MLDFETVDEQLGRYGVFGGRYVPETLMAAIEELTAAYFRLRDDADFQAELAALHHSYTGRPT
ncbi:MAG: tryptophan synthase subunit beta, partial [Herpetosiphon sp.]|nr:tryptophan synthase subunit beta [Herpetosiphon sp.]